MISRFVMLRILLAFCVGDMVKYRQGQQLLCGCAFGSVVSGYWPFLLPLQLLRRKAAFVFCCPASPSLCRSSAHLAFGLPLPLLCLNNSTISCNSQARYREFV
nr:MAG TPA: hypothetical protein [Caudoviricetes sp.]